MKLKTITIVHLGIAAMIGLSSCGKTEEVVPVSNGGGAVAEDGVRLVRITGNDQMKFNIEEIKASPGEKLRIEFSNIGRMPKQAMGHNWVLLAKMSEADANALSMAAATRAPEYLPEDKSGILYHTKLLGPGETDTIDITVPDEAGEYLYVCTFPGHFALMRGKLIVEGGGQGE